MVIVNMKEVLGGSYEQLKALCKLYLAQWIKLNGVTYNLPRATK